MLQASYFPKIVMNYTAAEEGLNTSLYTLAMQNIVRKILPRAIFAFKEADRDLIVDQSEHFHAQLPLFYYHLKTETPCDLSFYILYRYRNSAFKFFFEIMGRWLVPSKRLNVVMVYAADFKMPEIGEDLYTVCEVIIHVDNQEDLEQIQCNLPIIETEAKLGVESSYYARRILEIKGLSIDEKTAKVQEYVAFLVKRLPLFFDHDVFTEMQHVLVICRDNFKAKRASRHLSRIVSILYLFRKSLREMVKLDPEKRHLSLKLFRARLFLPEGEKNVLSLLMAINFLKEKEIFEKRHLLIAIQNYIPDVQAVEESFFANRRGTEQICTLYIEIEKIDGKEFNASEIDILRRELPIDLKDRIEHLMHPVFMPRNEEEVMRNILSLSNQIKYMRDIPQVTISFDEQTQTNLFFTVILVRLIKPGMTHVQNLFQEANTWLEYIHDRCKNLGYLRKKYVKEATIFRVKFPKEKFLRRDHSIDLYKARQAVFDELTVIVGEVRDFNGGMISKQNELLCSVRSLLGNQIKYNELLLENFFYSLSPVIMRTVMEPLPLKTLFLMQLEAIESSFFTGEGCASQIKTDLEFVYIMIKAHDRLVKQEINKTFTQLQIPSSDLTHSYVKVYYTPYMGYIYRCDDEQKQKLFCQTIQAVIQDCERKGTLVSHQN